MRGSFLRFSASLLIGVAYFCFFLVFYGSGVISFVSYPLPVFDVSFFPFFLPTFVGEVPSLPLCPSWGDVLRFCFSFLRVEFPFRRWSSYTLPASGLSFLFSAFSVADLGLWASRLTASSWPSTAHLSPFFPFLADGLTHVCPALVPTLINLFAFLFPTIWLFLGVFPPIRTFLFVSCLHPTIIWPFPFYRVFMV